MWILVLLVALVFLTTGCTKPKELPTPAPGQEDNAGAAPVNVNDDVNIDVDEEPEELMPKESAAMKGGLAPFSLADCHVLGVRLGMPEETVLTILGEQEKTTITFCEARDGNVKTLHYAFGALHFFEDQMLSFEVHTAGVDGPRGIQVGDTIQSVIDKFPNEQKLLEGENPRWATKTLYGSTMHGQAGGGIYYEAYEIIYGDGDYGVALRMKIENSVVSSFRCFFAAT